MFPSSVRNLKDLPLNLLHKKPVKKLCETQSFLSQSLFMEEGISMSLDSGHRIRISYPYQAFLTIWQTSVNSVFLRMEAIQIWQTVLARDDWQTFSKRVKTFHLVCFKKWRFCFRTTFF